MQDNRLAGKGDAIDGQTQFFVAGSGSDLADGRSPASAWRTITRVNSSATAGSRVNFNGGDTFSTTTGITANVSVTSYGVGKATISSGDSAPCISQTNPDVTLTLSNIICRGGGAATNATNGVLVQNTGSAQLPGPTISGLTVSGYGHDLIAVLGSATAGFDNITIANNTAHDGCDNGTSSFTGVGIRVDVDVSNRSTRLHTTPAITGNTVFNCAGTNNAAVFSGTGILVTSANGAYVASNYVHDNGSASPNMDGPVGIIFTLCDSCIMEKNVVLNQSTASSDGESYDFDWGVTNSVMRYNYSRGSKAGFFFFSANVAGSPTWNNNIAEFNISEDDAACLRFGNSASSAQNNGYFFNNSCYSDQNNWSGVIAITQSGTTSLTFANNGFYTVSSSGGLFVNIGSLAGQTLAFTGNNYFGTASFNWDGTNYDLLTAWQAASGQERVGGVSVGQTQEPRLVCNGCGGSVTAYNATPVTGYQLQAGSPMVGAGVDITAQYGVALASTDYFGAAYASSGRTIGAGQQIAWAGASSATCAEGGNAINRLTTPSVAQQQQVNAIICRLKATSHLSQFDALYKLAADTATNGRQNLISSGYSLTPHGSLTFTAGQGYTGDGSSGWLDTGYNSSTAGGHCTLNSCGSLVYVLTNTSSTNEAWDIGTVDARKNISGIAPSVNFSSGVLHICNSANQKSAGCDFVPHANAQGFYIHSRTGARASHSYLNGSVTGGTYPAASTALPNWTFGLLALNKPAGVANFSNHRIAYAGVTSGLSATDQLMVTYIVNADAIALGINSF